MLAVAGWYHDWLDRAERGDAAPPFGVAELAAQNAMALDELADLDGPAALELFVARATSTVTASARLGTCPSATHGGRSRPACTRAWPPPNGTSMRGTLRGPG